MALHPQSPPRPGMRNAAAPCGARRGGGAGFIGPNGGRQNTQAVENRTPTTTRLIRRLTL